MTPLPPSGPIYRYELSNATHITADESGRHLRDPYEKQYLEAKPSTARALNNMLKEREKIIFAKFLFRYEVLVGGFS